jgi:thiol:disulfide interchange protein DsbA
MTATTTPRPLLRAIAASLMFAAVATLAACGKPEAPAVASTPAATAAPPAEAAAASEPAPAPTVDSTATAPLATVAETGSEPAGPDLGKDIVLAAETATPAAPAQWKFRQGAHYSLLPAAQGTSSSPGKIEVAEVFWYGCPHCFDLEPQIKEWAARQPADVSFVKIPVTWQQPHEIHARLFYTAEALGKLDQISPEVFRAFHLQGKQLLEENEIRAFFGQFGVSAEQFNSTWSSFGVESALKRAKELTQRYRVRSVPLLIVNGKYVTDGPEIRSHKEQLELVDELIQRERSGT